MINEKRLPHIHVLAPSLSSDRVSWVQLFESRSVANELRQMGFGVTWSFYRGPKNVLTFPFLRLSDALMGKAAAELSQEGIRYAGPSPSAFERCYDKFSAYETLQREGIPCPSTALADNPHSFDGPIFLKPRRGSDSIGARIVQSGTIPHELRRQDYLAQPYIKGNELTVAVIGLSAVGIPMHILRPRGSTYSFVRKNLLKTKRMAVQDETLSRKIQSIARRVAELLEIDWAARIDMLHEPANDRLYVLECDACPTISATASFTESLSSAGISRARQIELLLQKGLS